MAKILISKILVLLSIIAVNSYEINPNFPKDFLIGAASAAYQVEGAWNTDGKSESIWDHFIHNNRDKIEDHSTADIAADFYHKYAEDIKLLKDLGLNHFRFSISWSRLFPKGYIVDPNPAAIRFYHKVLDELKKHQIVPFVTIYHWDHPQVLEKFGGWLNESMAYIYRDYAKFIFKEFGSRVKFFTTFNEPNIMCKHGYGMKIHAPGYDYWENGEYKCVQNQLKGNALAYQVYNKEFRNAQKGIIGVDTACAYCTPKNKDDTTSADVSFDFNCGWILHPLFSKTGDYPESMRQRIKARSTAQGRKESRLPTLSKYWIDLIRGSADYIGLNYYEACVSENVPAGTQVKDWPNDSGTDRTLVKQPEGLINLLKKITRSYKKLPIYILENGTVDNRKDDSFRLDYMHGRLREVLSCIQNEKIDVRAYTAWSFIDCFEWSSGYNPRFGLVGVNFNDKNLTRTPRSSALWLKQLQKHRKLQRTY